MRNETQNLENLISSAKTVDSKSFEVDSQYKELLREELVKYYLSNSKKGGSTMDKMKAVILSPKFLMVAFGVFLTVGLASAAGVYFLSNEGIDSTQTTEEVLLAANLSVADGDVLIMKSEDDRWMEGLQGDVLAEGDSIKTGKESRAVLTLDNGDAVRLNASSEVKLNSMDPKAVVVEQVYGESYNRVATSEENTFTIVGQGVEAQALGTAYLFKSDPVKKKVSVHVYESQVKLTVGEKEQTVKTLKKAEIDAEKKKIEVGNMKEDDLNTNFAKWNSNQDGEDGYDSWENTGPKVTISSPKDGYSTKESSVTVKGTAEDSDGLKKIIVNGNKYFSMEDGNGFDPSTGKYSVKIDLSFGKNTIKVQGWDVYWNSGKTVSVSVEREGEEPSSGGGETSSFYISAISSPKNGKIQVNWVVSNGYDYSKGFKVCVSKTNVSPSYPTDNCDLKSAETREALKYVSSGGTYYVRVGIYNGDGGVTSYTSTRTVNVESGEVQGEVSKIVLSKGSGDKVTWTVTGYSSNGFKVVWSKKSGPTYPTRSGDKYHYLSSPGARTDTPTAFDGVGSYYVRVCEYLGGSCGVYSNQISVTLD